MSETYLDRFKDKIMPFLKDSINHRSVFFLFFDVLYNKLFFTTSPADYFRFEFYKKNKSISDKKRYISKLGSYYYPWGKNPISFVSIFDDKLIFKRMLKGSNIPQAELLGIIGSDFKVSTKQQFFDWLAQIKQDVVIKPIYGSGGEYVHLLNYKNNTFFEKGYAVDVNTLWEDLVPRLNLGYIAEERLINIPEISEFNPDCFHTLRVVTIKTDDGKWHIAMIALRIGKRGSAVDNLSAGATFVKFNELGIGECAYDVMQKCHVERHFDTDKMLIGYKLNNLQEINNFVINAAEQFSFMGAIGWDIGLTINGLKVIEANPYFDAWYWQMGQLGPMLTEEIARGLKHRTIFSKWDRSFISPSTRGNKIRA